MAYLSCGFDGMPCLNYFENSNDGIFCDGMEWISGIIWITNVILTWLAYYRYEWYGMRFWWFKMAWWLEWHDFEGWIKTISPVAGIQN